MVSQFEGVDAIAMNQSFNIVGIGEILWDVFPDGARFGGAPANFACHAAALNGSASIVSCVGQDTLGEQALAALADRHVSTDGVARLPDRPTGTVTVEIDELGKPAYRFGLDDAWDHLAWSTELAELARQTQAVCFGTLGQRNSASRETIQHFVAATPAAAWRVCDINLRSPFYDAAVIRQSVAAANVLKLNDEELPIVAAACGVPGRDADALAQLASRFSLRAVALTRGAEGAILLRGNESSDCPGMPVEVRDTVGAGDAFTAALVLGLLRGDELETINRRAGQIAAFVCSQPGATPSIPAELL
jgi:fructokinase